MTSRRTHLSKICVIVLRFFAESRSVVRTRSQRLASARPAARARSPRSQPAEFPATSRRRGTCEAAASRCFYLPCVGRRPKPSRSQRRPPLRRPQGKLYPHTSHTFQARTMKVQVNAYDLSLGYTAASLLPSLLLCSPTRRA